MRRVLLLLLAILVPAFEKDASAQNFIIEKVREIPIDLGDEIVGQISDLAKDAEGNFYLTDRQQHTIWVTDPQGNLIRRIGRQGSGPGELSKPRSGTILEDRILVLDVGNNRISTFSKRGGFLSSFRTNLPGPGNIIAHSDGRIAVSSLMGESLFTVFAPDGKKLGEHGSRMWPPDPPIPVTIGGAFQHLSPTPEGNILYSPVKLYEVHEIDWDGSIRVTYTAEPSGYFPMEISSLESAADDLKGATRIFRPLILGENVLIQRFRFKGELGEGLILHIDLFTRDGDLVQMDIESPTNFIYAADDELYAIDNAPVVAGELNPYIAVYRLKDGQKP